MTVYTHVGLLCWGRVQNALFLILSGWYAHGNLRHWNAAECVYLLQGQYVVMENCVTGILQSEFTLCQGNKRRLGELRQWNTAWCVYLLQGQCILSWRTASLEYCRICLPSVRAIYYRHGDLRHWNIAECVTEIVQNVFTFYKGNTCSGRITSWRPAPLEYCRMCLTSARAICSHGELHHWNTAQCVYSLPGQ